jgi:hypothetical protein
MASNKWLYFKANGIIFKICSKKHIRCLIEKHNTLRKGNKYPARILLGLFFLVILLIYLIILGLILLFIIA